MPSAKLAKQKPKLHPHEVKRHGKHHKHSNHYVKVYWPYMPLLLIAAFGSILVLSGHKKSQPGVLDYATQISTTALLSQTNNQRAQNHQSALANNEQLTAAAQAKANDMATRNYWSHNTPDGQEPWVFLEKAGYKYQKAGENLAYGFETSQDTITGWMNSPGHRANLLDPAFTEVGFGFANVPDYQGDGPVTIVVAEYGEPFTATSHASPTTNAPTVLSNQTQAVSRLAAMTHGSLPTWAGFALGLLGGISLTYLLIKHSLGLRKLVLKGESLFLHHPYLDALLLAVVFTAVFLNQSVGFIR